MKIFAYEHCVGGGLINQAMPDLAHYHGQIMWHALISDLATLPGVEVITTIDPRLAIPDLPNVLFVVAKPDEFEQCFGKCVEMANAVWPLAPETDGILEKLSCHIIQSNRMLLGSRPEAVRLTTSKKETSRLLRLANIPVVDTFSPGDSLPHHVDTWVAKPDDGHGCVDTWLFRGADAALEWMRANKRNHHVLQPYLPGKPCSLCLLCRHGMVEVLSCNEQRVAMRGNQFFYFGSIVNSIADVDGRLARLAQDIVAALPGLWGYVGVDFIMTSRGPVVLEINARMTTSFAGLHASLNANPAAMVIDMLSDAISLPLPRRSTRALAVNVNIEDAHFC